jgi:hypothetical protein
MAHDKNTAIVLFNIPERDPWPSAGRKDWIEYRDQHLERLLTDAYVALPKSMDEKSAADVPGLEGARWRFFREGETYIGVAALTQSGMPAVDRYRVGIRARGRKNAERFQTGFVFHVGTKQEYGSLADFADRLRGNVVSVDWGTGTVPTPDVSYTHSGDRQLRIRYNNELTPGENGVVENLPEVWIDDVPLRYNTWPDMEGPGVLLRDAVLTIEHNGKATRIDWAGRLPMIRGDAP